jgi:alcohol dehydrogenase class IV
MSFMPLNLLDLVPKETAFELSTMPGVKITLGRWSLRVRAWAVEKYTAGGLGEIFQKQKISEIAEIAFFMLKDKEQFKTKDEFLDAISSMQDQLNVILALLGAVGIGEPEMKKITDEMKKHQAPAATPPDASKKKSKKIGAKSLTR